MVAASWQLSQRLKHELLEQQAEGVCVRGPGEAHQGKQGLLGHSASSQGLRVCA